MRGRDSLISVVPLLETKNHCTADLRESDADWLEAIRAVFVPIRGEQVFCFFREGYEKASANPALAFSVLEQEIRGYFPVGQTTPWLPRLTDPTPM